MENQIIQLTMEQFMDFQKSMIDSVVKHLGLDHIDAKYKINPQGDEKRQLELTKKQRFVELLRLMHSKQYEKIMSQAMSEGIDPDGGYLVPEQVRADILHFVNEYGTFRLYGTIFDLTGQKTDTLKIPRLLADVTIAWVNEKSVIGESNPTFEDVTLLLKKLAAISTVTEELLDDSLLILYDFLMERFGEKIAYAEDYQAFTANAAPFTGILRNAGVTSITLSGPDVTSMGYDDLVDMQSALSNAKLKGARWFGHPTIFGECRKVKDLSGNPILTTATSGPMEFMLGYPVEKVDAMPSKADIAASTPFLAFGNGRHLGAATKGEIAFKISDVAVVGGVSMFEQGEQALRVMERAGFAGLLPGGFTVMKTSAG